MDVPGETIQIIKDIRDELKNNSVGIIDVLILLSAAIACIASIVSNLKLIKLPSEARDISSPVTKKDIEQDKKIESYLDRILGITGASKVILSMFHNGDKVGKFHFKYVSTFWEVTNDGVTPVKAKYQKIDFSTIRYEVERGIAANGGFIYYSHKDNLNEAYRLYLLENNSRFVISRLLGNESNGYIALLNIHLSDCPIDVDLPFILAKIRPQFDLLEGLILKPYFNK